MTTTTVDRRGRRLERAARRVAPDEILMAVVVPDRVHEGLCSVACRRQMNVEELVAMVLERLANDLGGPR